MSSRDTRVSPVIGMRGAGGMFGFPAITEFGGFLEDAATVRDADLARSWVEQLSAYLDQPATSDQSGV